MGIERKVLCELRVVDLKQELEKRGLDSLGVKAVLMERLTKALQDEGVTPESHVFEITAGQSSPQGDETDETFFGNEERMYNVVKQIKEEVVDIDIVEEIKSERLDEISTPAPLSATGSEEEHECHQYSVTSVSCSAQVKTARSNTSALWDFFEKLRVGKKAKCNCCGEVYSFQSSTANLKTHLKRKHRAAYTFMCNAQSNMGQPPPPPLSSHGEELRTAVDVESEPSSSTSNTPRTRATRYRVVQQRTETCELGVKLSATKQNQIDMDVADLFIDSFLPFSLVEERAFKKLVRHIPGYELPSRQTLEDVLIPALYGKTVQSNEEIAGIDWISLTTDLWTSHNDAYMAVTGHYITKDLYLKTALLKCTEFQDGPNSENIKNALLEITKKWQVTDKINFIVSDNGANVTKAINDLGWTHYGCFAHTLNLIVQDALRLVEDSLDKIKATVRHFKRSTAKMDKLLEAQTQDDPDGIAKRLIEEEEPIRWNATFAMLQRFVELEKPMNAVLEKDFPTLTDEEWIVCRELCTVLEGFDAATKSMMSGENYVTASSIIGMASCLKEGWDHLLMEGFASKTNSVITAMRTGLDERLGGVEKNETFVMCTMLDPRYKIHVFSDPNDGENATKVLEEAVADVIRRQCKEPEPEPEKSTSGATPAKMKYLGWIQNKVGSPQTAGQPSSRAMREVELYLMDDPLRMINESDKFNCPLEWWRRNRNNYPNLAVLVPKYANIMATSVPCERIFSKTGLTISNRRSQLETKKVKQLMYLNVNLDPKRFDM